MSEARPFVGICMPVLDERAALGGVVDRVREALADVPFTLCIVDDGSTDGTRELVRTLASADPRIRLVEGRRLGPGCRRGRATRRGIAWLLANTAADVFVDLDGDGSQRPEELGRGIAVVTAGQLDVVIASKYLPGSRVAGRSPVRRLGSLGYSGLMRVLMGGGLHDYSNSYRFYNRRAAEMVLRIDARHDGPPFLLEMLAAWLSNGLRVGEFPTDYDDRAGGASKVTPGDLVRGVRQVLGVAVAFRRGRYREAV